MANNDPIKILVEDHKKVEKLFKMYEDSGQQAYQEKQDIADQIFEELDIHSQLEEEIFYPAVQKLGGGELKAMVIESLEEHKIMKELIAELKEIDSDEDELFPKMKTLKEQVEHHVKEEESDFFPEAKDAIESDKESLADDMQTLKDRLRMR